MNWSAFWGAFIGTMINLIEIGLLIKLSKSIQCMLKQFKAEGDPTRWQKYEEVMPYCRQYRPLSMQDMEEWYSKLNDDKDYNLTNDMFMLSYKDTKIGVGGFTRIDWRNRKAELSFYVGEDSSRNQKTISSAIMAIVEYGFKTLNLWKIYFPVYSFNPNLPMYQKVLKEEYTAKKEYYWEGKYWNRVILVAYNET
jgi:hypothetical protein